MPNFFYCDATGQKQGPVGDEQLRTLATRGTITPQTPLETEAGHKGLAEQIPGLFAPSPFIQSTASISSVFCTNCGKPVAANAVACMSCGARPTGHKNFCRACGVGVNPQQIICVKCGAALENIKPGGVGHGSVSGSGDVSNSGPMWMHLTWPFVPLATFIIWSVIKDKHPQANVHGKNILNAFFSTIIAYGIGTIGTIFWFALFVATVEGPGNDASPVKYAIIVGLLILMGLGILFLFLRPFVSAITMAIAAGKGEIRPYKWATKFIKT